MPRPVTPSDWNEVSRRIEGLFRAAMGADASQWRPNTDIYETEDGLVVRMELAGATREDLHIEVANGVLIVRGVRAEPPEDCEARRVYRQAEVEYGPFSRTIPLPPWADPAAVEAQYRGGFLTIQIERVADPTPQKVRVDIVDG